MTPVRGLLRRLCVPLLVLAGLTAPAYGQAVRYDSSTVAVRVLPDDVLRPYRDDPAYHYLRAQAPASWWDRFKQWLWERLTAPFRSQAAGPVTRVLLYVLVAAAVGYALLRLLRMDAGGLFYARPADGRLRMEEEGDLAGLDLDRLIDEAVTVGDYRRAVRLSYLRLLQHLSARGLITWRAEKTNRDYAEELGASPLRAPFARLTALFDHVWYGDFPVDAALFARVHADFDRLMRGTGEG